MKIKENLEILIRPSYWMMNNQYNKLVDKEINRLLDNHKFEVITDCTASLGNKKIWIENIPYACMNFYDSRFKHLRPSRKTTLRAVRRLKEDTKKCVKYDFEYKLAKFLSE